MGKIREMFFGPNPPSPRAPMTRFSAQPVGSDFETWNALIGAYAGQTATRRDAMSVPAIKAARDKFCGLGSILPLHVRNSLGEKLDNELFTQPERFSGLTRGYTLSWTIDDLFFYGQCLWKVVDRSYTGYPSVVDRIPHGRWTIDSETRTVMVDGTKINPMDAIIFNSPNDGILTVGGGVIKALMALEATAAMRINQPQAMEYFKTTDGSEPDEDEVRDFLSDIAAARKNNASGWLPYNIERIPTETVTPEQLQLADSRSFSILEVSRLTGLNPIWLAAAVAGSSMTYQNLQDARRDFIETQASPYLRSIEERLSLGDVTPRGQRVLFNLDAFLRASTLERYQAHEIGIRSGWLLRSEVRSDYENKPAIPGLDSQPSPGVTNGQV